MTRAGVPCVPGYHGSNQDPSHLLSEAESIGFPVLIKAVLGGGGKGMRIVLNAHDFPEALESAKREALKSFSDERVLVEKYIVRPRHVEVQVFGDQMGNVVSLWERDCSVQRRHQKIIEEAPAPRLDEAVRADLSDKAVAAANAVNYVGAGTVEFILDNDTNRFYFMEMNTRLQVEHPVTEMITGQDLVQWQLEVAAGNPLPLTQSEIPRIGHAFEARIYAENPRNNFLPDVGPLVHISTPTPGPNLRLEEGFKQGSNIEVFYDPMISKLVAHGRNRTEALRVLGKALEEYHIVGVSTNVEFLRNLAGNQHFIDGDVETGFISKHYEELFPPLAPPTPTTLAQAALYVVLTDASLASAASRHQTPWSSLSFGRLGGEALTREIVFNHEAIPATGGRESAVTSTSIVSVTPHRRAALQELSFNITIRTTTLTDNTSTEHSFADVRAATGHEKATELVTTINDQRLRTTVVRQLAPHPRNPPSLSNAERLHVFHAGTRTTLVRPPPTWLLSLSADLDAAKSKGVKAPMPSVVVNVKVAVGQKVTKGQSIVVLESMKTEIVLRAEKDATVRTVACQKGEMVEEGKELVTFEEEQETFS